MSVKEREISAREVRQLPEGTKVVLHGTDRYGNPTTRTLHVHRTMSGGVVLQDLSPYSEGWVPVRAGRRYTVDAVEDAERRQGG